MSKRGAPGISRGYKLHGLLEAMREKGITRTELSEKSGIAYSTLWRLESQRHGASAYTLSRISEALGIEEGRLRRGDSL